MSKFYYVDIPGTPGEYWQNVATCDTRKEAIEFVRENYGGDDEGRIQPISMGDDGEDRECPGCGEAIPDDEHSWECQVCSRLLCTFCITDSGRCPDCETAAALALGYPLEVE